jgi:hypothetical protein
MEVVESSSALTFGGGSNPTNSTSGAEAPRPTPVSNVASIPLSITGDGGHPPARKLNSQAPVIGGMPNEFVDPGLIIGYLPEGQLNSLPIKSLRDDPEYSNLMTLATVIMVLVFILAFIWLFYTFIWIGQDSTTSLVSGFFGLSKSETPAQMNQGLIELTGDIDYVRRQLTVEELNEYPLLVSRKQQRELVQKDYLDAAFEICKESEEYYGLEFNNNQNLQLFECYLMKSAPVVRSQATILKTKFFVKPHVIPLYKDRVFAIRGTPPTSFWYNTKSTSTSGSSKSLETGKIISLSPNGFSDSYTRIVNSGGLRGIISRNTFNVNDFDYYFSTKRKHADFVIDTGKATEVDISKFQGSTIYIMYKRF